MTVRVIVSCDGDHGDRPDMALESCRGFLPVGNVTDGTVAVARASAQMRGYTRDGDRDLCPACTRARKEE